MGVFTLLGVVLVASSAGIALLALYDFYLLYGLRSRPVVEPGDIGENGDFVVCGRVACSSPVEIPGWKTRCVYYHAVVEEPSAGHRLPDGCRAIETGGVRVRGSKREYCNFRLVDSDGEEIEVHPARADMEGPELESDPAGAELLAGSLGFGGGRHARARVRAIKEGSKAIAAGTVEFIEGRRVMRKGSPFLVSGGTLDTAIESRKEKLLLLALVGLVFFGAGALLLFLFLPSLG